MRIEDREDFVDLVAQAVIDRIEERDRIAGLVNMVVQRVIDLQKEQAEAERELAAQAVLTNQQDPTETEETAGAGKRDSRHPGRRGRTGDGDKGRKVRA